MFPCFSDPNKQVDTSIDCMNVVEYRAIDTTCKINCIEKRREAGYT